MFYPVYFSMFFLVHILLTDPQFVDASTNRWSPQKYTHSQNSQARSFKQFCRKSTAETFLQKIYRRKKAAEKFLQKNCRGKISAEKLPQKIFRGKIAPIHRYYFQRFLCETCDVIQDQLIEYFKIKKTCLKLL
jgi:hypothetical protein